ncbi:aldo/keto reductase [Arthrobacter sulfonylureivorans]|uniref:aldo/keto reductase n=1 Tax=Arthrobacter sulfonylureivorans TaxID=2486855 RepID=UPI0039E24A50
MRLIGTSDLKIFPLALGGNTFGWTSDEPSSQQVLDAFADAGGNFIDTADSYSAWVPGNTGGESERIIGRWMAERKNRDSVVIATKVGGHPELQGLSAVNIAAAAEASLQRLGTDHIDLYYAHYDDEGTPLIEAAAAFDALVKEGKVRQIGLSNLSPERITQWITIAQQNGFALPVALQPHYNLVARKDYEQGYAPLAREHNLSVFPYFSLAAGFLTGKYHSTDDAEASPRGGMVGDYLTTNGFAVVDAVEAVASSRGISITTAALAWLLSKPGITAPLASARTPQQLPELMAAVDVDLTAEEVSALDQASRPFA